MPRCGRLSLAPAPDRFSRLEAGLVPLIFANVGTSPHSKQRGGRVAEGICASLASHTSAPCLILAGFGGPKTSIDPKETSLARRLLIVKFPGALRKRAIHSPFIHLFIFHFSFLISQVPFWGPAGW